jgi:hypothetical protein
MKIPRLHDARARIDSGQTIAKLTTNRPEAATDVDKALVHGDRVHNSADRRIPRSRPCRSQVQRCQIASLLGAQMCEAATEVDRVSVDSNGTDEYDVVVGNGCVGLGIPIRNAPGSTIDGGDEIVSSAADCSKPPANVDDAPLDH